MSGVFSNLLGTIKDTFKVAKLTFDASSVSTAKTITLPNKTGTAALTSDFQTEFATSYSASFTIDWTNGDGTEVTLTGNPTINFSGSRLKVILKIRQDATGGRTITWGGNITYLAGIGVINLNTTANAVTVLGFVYDATTAKYNIVANSYDAATYGFAPTYVNQTGATLNESATSGFKSIFCDCTANGITVNLPSAVGNTAVLNIKKTDSSANTVILDPQGSQTIDGGATATLATQYESISLVSNNSDWMII